MCRGQKYMLSGGGPLSSVRKWDFRVQKWKKKPSSFISHWVWDQKISLNLICGCFPLKRGKKAPPPPLMKLTLCIPGRTYLTLSHFYFIRKFIVDQELKSGVNDWKFGKKHLILSVTLNFNMCIAMNIIICLHYFSNCFLLVGQK